MLYDASIIPHDELQAFLRVLLAVLAGGIIGLNREMAGKPAGLRTHMLVSLGAALFALIPLLTSEGHAADALGRTVQGVAAGVGFLGAGEIIHEIGSQQGTAFVHGLTSAASIWVTAAVGMAAGCGFWKLTVVAAVLVLIILSGAQRLERSLRGR